MRMVKTSGYVKYIPDCRELERSWDEQTTQVRVTNFWLVNFPYGEH